MSDNPTLKVRFQVNDPMIGLDCHQFAAEIAAATGRVEVLDAKWGRTPTQWNNTGKTWGRGRLTEWQKGFLAACSFPPDSVEQHLVDIIKGLAS